MVTKAVKTVKKTTLKTSEKPVVKSAAKVTAAKAISKEDANLKKLAKSPIPMNFVKKNNGFWNHQGWLSFLESIKEKGYEPIDTDKVGLLLEDKKAQFLAGK